MITKAKIYDFKYIYKTYNKAMFNICMRFTGDYNRSKDILQDAFLIAIQKVDSLRDPERLGGWLKSIVVNECIKESRRYTSWDDISGFELTLEDEPSVDHWWEGISMEALVEELKNLPNGCRQVFILYAIENYPHKEIKEMLGISESTSKTQYKRAKDLLKNLFEKKKSYG